jgi:hypothetical protein
VPIWKILSGQRLRGRTAGFFARDGKNPLFMRDARHFDMFRKICCKTHLPCIFRKIRQKVKFF